MSAITIEGPMLEKLRGASSGTTLRDPAGNSIGHVISDDDYLKVLYARARERYTDEEIEELRQQPPVGISTEELIKRLQSSWATK